MKPGEVLRHPQNFSKLNLQSINYEEHLRNRISKITVNPVTTTPILDEIRDISFYIPSTDLETATNAVSLQIINVIIHLANAPSTPEIISFRIRLLDLLSILNYHFFPVAFNSEFFDVFFRIISDGTINEMAAAVKLLRQSFDTLESPNNNAFLLTIGKNTLNVAEKRLKNLIEHSISADKYSFFPFLTLLTVLSYCAKKLETLREPIGKVLIATESFAKSIEFDKKRFGTALPLFAIKARIIHSLALLIDSPQRDKQLSFLLDSYINLFKNCPISYSTIIDEISSSFHCYLSQKPDDERIERLIKIVPAFLTIPLGKPEYFYSSISITSKLFEVLLSYAKLPWPVIDQMITYTTNVIHYSDVVLISRCQKFSYFAVILLKRLNLLDMRSSRPLFLILFNIYHAFQLINESIVDMKINPKTESTEMKRSQQHIYDMTILFESFSRILEIFYKTVRLINLYQKRLEEIAQDGHIINKAGTPSQQQMTLQQINTQKYQQQQQQQQQQSQQNKLLQQQQQITQQLQLQRLQKQFQQQQQQNHQQQQSQSQAQSTAQALGLSLKHSASITTANIASIISSIASMNSANKNPNLNLNLVNSSSSSAAALNLSALVSRSQTSTTPVAKVAAAVIQNASSYSTNATPTVSQAQQQQQSIQQQQTNSANLQGSSTSIPKLKIAYPFDCAGANLLVNSYVSILFIFLRIRVILHQCNLKFSLKPTKSDYISNLKSCANHKRYVQYYEKERYYNQISFKIIVESLFQTKTPILINIWERFIEKLIGKNGMSINDIYFIRFFLSYPVLFGPFYRAFVKEVIKGLQNPSNLNSLFHIGNEVLERLIEFGLFQGEVKDLFIKQILKDTKLLFKVFETNFVFLQDARESLNFLTNISKFLTILIFTPMNKKQNPTTTTSLSGGNNSSTSSSTSTFSDLDSFLREVLTTKLIKTICTSIADYPSDLSSLLNFLSYCNGKLPHIVENEAVITVLANIASIKPNHSLSLIAAILKRRPDLIQDGITSEISSASYSRSSNLAEVALNALLYLPEANTPTILLKFLKRAPIEFVRPDSISANRCVFSFPKGELLANFDSEMFLSAFSSAIELSEDMTLWDSLLFLILDLLLVSKSNKNEKNKKVIDKNNDKDLNEFLNSNYSQTGYSNSYLICSKFFVYIASFIKKRENEVKHFFDSFFNNLEVIINRKIDYKTNFRIKSLAFVSIIQYIDEIGEEIVSISKLIGNSKENFTYFFLSCVEIIESVPISNSLIKESMLVDFALSTFPNDVINLQLLTQIAIHSISQSPLLSDRENLEYRNTIDFHFHELTLIPEFFKSIIDRLKSLISLTASMENSDNIFDPTILLNYVKSATSSSMDPVRINWTRIISSEFLTVSNIDQMIVEQFISNLFQCSEYRIKLLIFDIISPLLRCFPSLTIKFIDQIDSLLDYYIKDSHVIDKTLENQISSIIIPILQCDEIKDASKYCSLIDSTIHSIEKTIPDFLYLIKNKASSDKFTEAMQTLKSKLNNDGLYDLKKSSNSYKQQPLANWCNISKYWRSVFYITRRDFVHTLIAQFTQFSDGIIDSLSIDRIKEFYHSITSIISDKIIVKQILEEDNRNNNNNSESTNSESNQNESNSNIYNQQQQPTNQQQQQQQQATLIDQVILGFLKIFDRYNATITDDMYVPLIHFIEATGTNYANTYLSKYLQARRTTLSIRYLLLLPEGKNLRFNLFNSNKEFILAHLNLDNPKNLQQLQYFNQQQQQQQQDASFYMLHSLPSESTISYALLCPGLPDFETIFLIPYLKIFRRFLILKKETFSFALLLEPIIQYFEIFQPYLLSIIIDAFLTQDPTVVSYIKRIIKLYINYPKVTKETLTTVQFVQRGTYESENVAHYDLFNQNIHNFNEPIIIEDNEDNSNFSYYVKSILLPYSKLNENCASFFYSHYGTTISRRILMAYLFIDVSDFKFTSTESFEMLQSCESDIEKDQIYYIWSKSIQNGHFNEMICDFLDSINVHISVYAKNVFDTLKIPTGNNEIDVDLILSKIEEAIYRFLRHPNVLMSIWGMLTNNIDAFPNLTERLWPLILTQVANVRFYAKKTQIASTTPIAEALTKIFTYAPPPMNFNHQVINYFSIFLTATLKSIIDNSNSIPIKKSIPILKCCKKLNAMYGDQIHIATDFFQIFLEYFTKNVQQQQQLQLQQQQQHISQTSASAYQFIFDTLLQYVPKMISSVLKFNPPFKLESVVDALLPISLLTSSTSWPYALNTLHQIASYNFYTDKMKKLVDSVEKEETGVFIFPLLWINNAFAEYRIPILLPSAIKWCTNPPTNNNNNNNNNSNNQQTNQQQNQSLQQQQNQSLQQQSSQQNIRNSNQQQNQQGIHQQTSSSSNNNNNLNSNASSNINTFQETSIHQFMLKATFKTMIDYPVGQTLQKLFYEMNQENSKRYASFFLPSILSTPPKSRFVSKDVENLLQDPKICMIIASPNFGLSEEDFQFKLSIIAKLSYIMTHPDSKYLDELVETTSNNEFDFSVDKMKALVAAAQKVDSLEIPLSIVMYKFLPKFITSRLSIQRFFQIAHLFRPEYNRMSLNSLFLPNSRLKIDKKSILNELESYDKMNSIDDVFPSLSEYQVFDLVDSKHFLSGKKISSVSTFLHHGMLTHALFSAKNSLQDICKEDLTKIRMKDSAFTNFTEEWIKEEVSSLSTNSSNSSNSSLTPQIITVSAYLNTSNDAISNAIRDLPSKSKIPFSNKLAALFFASKLKKISKLFKIENEIHKKKQHQQQQLLLKPLKNGIFNKFSNTKHFSNHCIEICGGYTNSECFDSLPHFYTPSAHKAYEELRKSTYSLLKIDRPDSLAESIHHKNMMKSFRQNFIKERPPLPSPDALVSTANEATNYKKLLVCFASNVENNDWQQIFDEILKKALTSATVKKENPSLNLNYNDNSNDDLLLSFLYRNLVSNNTSFIETFNFDSCFGSTGIPFRWAHIFSEIKNETIQNKIQNYLPISFWPIRKNLLPFNRRENVNRVLEAAIDALNESYENSTSLEERSNLIENDEKEEIDEFDNQIFQCLYIQSSSLSQNKTPMPFFPSTCLNLISSYSTSSNSSNSSQMNKKHPVVYHTSSSLEFDDLIQCVDSVSPIATKVSHSSLRLFFRSTRGEKIIYTISLQPVIESRLSTFSSLMSRVFNNFVDTRRRGMRTINYQSFLLHTTNGSSGYVTRTQDAIPLPKLPISKLSSRWSTDQHKKLFSLLPSSQFLSTSEFVNWSSIFSYRYAALCSLQLLFGAEMIEIGDMTIDHKQAITSVQKMHIIKTENENKNGLLRLNGILKFYIDDMMKFGPFKAGLVSSFLCMCYKREKIRVFLMNILLNDENESENDCKFTCKEAEERINEISKLSIAENNLDEVDEKIVALIKCSAEHHDEYDQVFSSEYEKYNNSPIFM